MGLIRNEVTPLFISAERRRDLMNNHREFKKVFSSKDIIALAFGAMIGWGWVVLTGSWLKTAGSMGAILAFLMGGLMVLLVGLAYAELTAALPFNGGISVFTNRAMGKNASFFATWAIILGYISVVAFETVAFPSVIESLFDIKDFGKTLYEINGYEIKSVWLILGISSSLAVTAINYFGGKSLAAFQTLVTLMIAVTGISLVTGSVVTGVVEDTQPLFLGGAKGVFAVAIMTPFMFLGFDVIPQAAQEMNVPAKKIGRLLILSVFMAVVWYVGIIFATSISLNQFQISTSQMVTATAMESIFNSRFAGKILILAGIGGIITSWNSFFIGGSRAIQSMADNGMLPPFLGKLHRKYKTPSNAILLVGLLTTSAPLLGKPALTWFVNSGSLAVVIAYFMVSLSFLILRNKEPKLQRPYKVRYGKMVGIGAVMMTGFLFMLALPGLPSALSAVEWAILLVWFFLGTAFYTGRKNLKRKIIQKGN